jgi:hypothetical protein
MTPPQSARVLSALHGAYPHVEIDDSVAAVWANGLALADYRHAMLAVGEWIQTSTWWPTLAEFNAIVRRHRDNDPDFARPALTPEPAVDLDTGRAAFVAAYRQSRAARGDTDEQIDGKASAYVGNFPSSVPGI